MAGWDSWDESSSVVKNVSKDIIDLWANFDTTPSSHSEPHSHSNSDCNAQGPENRGSYVTSKHYRNSGFDRNSQGSRDNRNDAQRNQRYQPRSEYRQDFGRDEKRLYNTSNLAGGSNERKHFNTPLEDCKTIMVSSSDVGRIIGRGGAKIKELQEESGARIKVEK